MMIRKLKHKRCDAMHVSSDRAARLLNISCACSDGLVRAGELSPARHVLSDGRRRFLTAQLPAYKRRRRIEQRDGLTRMVKASERMRLYEAELEGLPAADMMFLLPQLAV
jgi:hypothetical protein